MNGLLNYSLETNAKLVTKFGTNIDGNAHTAHFDWTINPGAASTADIVTFQVGDLGTDLAPEARKAMILGRDASNPHNPTPDFNWNGTLKKTGLGTLILGGGGGRSYNTNATSGLQVDEGTLQVGSAAGDITLAAVTIAGGAVVDLTNNDLKIDYTGLSPYNTIKGYVAGGQLDSSVAIGAGVGATGLGYGEATDVDYISEPDATSVIVKYTYLGDANLDGQVDVTDLGRLATNWQTSGDWVDGDFDYSGFIDVTDLGVLATNWQQGVGSPLSLSFSEAMALFPQFSGVSIPEPASLGLLALGAMGLMGRRRK